MVSSNFNLGDFENYNTYTDQDSINQANSSSTSSAIFQTTVGNKRKKPTVENEGEPAKKKRKVEKAMAFDLEEEQFKHPQEQQQEQQQKSTHVQKTSMQFSELVSHCQFEGIEDAQIPVTKTHPIESVSQTVVLKKAVTSTEEWTKKEISWFVKMTAKVTSGPIVAAIRKFKKPTPIAEALYKTDITSCKTVGDVEKLAVEAINRVGTTQEEINKADTLLKQYLKVYAESGVPGVLKLANTYKESLEKAAQARV